MNLATMTALEIGTAVQSGQVSALRVVDAALEAIEKYNPPLNAFTSVASASARACAAEIDSNIAAGLDVGPLAGVPFAAKDLFDIQSEVTMAGANLRRSEPKATRDASSIARMRAAGAVYMGRLNMDEFAYGFATVNAHFGTTRNPHDLDRLSGGSSGGSAAAVAARLVPLSLGSDTNGSVRVPAGLCGVFGLRPTHGALPMDGVFPFVEQLDTIGPFARTIEDLAATFRILADTPTPQQKKRAFKVARLGGWFRRAGDPDGNDGVDEIASSFGSAPLIELPLTEAARSAAFLITSKYGGRLHQETLQTHAMEYDPAVRDRLIAGIALSDRKVAAAKRIIERYNQELHNALSEFDLLIAPTTPSTAPKVSEGLIEVDGKLVSARANLGLYTQPLSVSGVPILSAPLRRPNKLPLGVQLIAERGNEEHLFSAAERLAQAGIIGFSPPQVKTVEAVS
ncbi:MAG: AtzE family amidohydrolase [Pseudomonadota bacterium]